MFDNLKEEFSQNLYEQKGKILDFCVDEVILPNGKKSVREYIKHRGAVAVIPVDSQGNVYLVNQYRYPAKANVLELPAGKLDYENEDWEKAAKRELWEETGLCGDLTYIGEFMGSPAINNEIIRIYFADNITDSGNGRLDEDEFLNVVKMPLKRLCELVMNGEIIDGKTAFAALWADRKINGSK